MNDSDVGMLNIDMAGRIIETNPAFRNLLSYTPAEMQGHRVQEFTPVEDLHIGNDVMAPHGAAKSTPSHSRNAIRAATGRASGSRLRQP